MPNDRDASRGSASVAGVFEEVNRTSRAPHSRRTAEDWSLSIEDRRVSPRLDGHLPTVLHCGDRHWRGESRSIGLGGVSLTLAGDIPAMLNQHVRLSLDPGSDSLESLGIVCGIRATDDQLAPDKPRSWVTLAVKFLDLSDGDEQLVTSLLAEGRIQSSRLCIAAALVEQQNDEGLIDANVDAPAMIPKSPKGSVGGSEGPRQERRRHRRLAVGLMTQVRLLDGRDRVLLRAATKNLTFTGACVCIPAVDGLTGSKLLVEWTTSTANTLDSDVDTVETTSCSVVGRVLWTRSQRPAASSGLVEATGHTVLAGIQFLPVAKDTKSSIEALLEQVQPSSRAEADRSDGPSVISECSACFRPCGTRIVLCYDRPRTEVADDAPIVVLAPGYGEGKRDYVALAYYLASNGFHVVRYDNVNHVGESDGVVTEFRLEDMELDLGTVLNYVAGKWPGRSIGLVATSLAGRVALKVTGETSHVKLLVLINGIMDVRHTLQSVHQEDLIGEHLAGMRKGVVNILGLTIDADHWLAQAVHGNYADLATTERDAERLRTPVVLFHAEHDAWVDPSSIRTVVTAVGPYLRHSYVVPGALHRLQESPRKARMVYRQIAMSCWEELWPKRPFEKLHEPSHREIGVQNRAERERSKSKRSIAKSDHVAFWKDYLHNFQAIPNVADFWRLMDHVYRLMGDCHDGERILDAGCGNGNFGVFLQLNQAFRQRYARRGYYRPPEYVGVDFVPTALAQATTNFMQVETTLQGQFREDLRAYAPMATQLCRADLEAPLPFPDHSFDRVVCNLVIGYVRDPLFTVREYLRVLRPQGRLVLSNLKPYADLSAIYRSFVETAHTRDQIEEGRRLLDNSGRIKEREGEGIFNFLHHAELEGLLQAAGAFHPRVYSTFGNQALIAVTEKSAASLIAAA